MGTTLDETRLELEAQRARVRGTAERLETTARHSFNVRAIIGRHPVRVLALGAGAAYAFRLCTGRTPKAEEVAELLKLFESQKKRIADGYLSSRELTTGDAAKLPAIPEGVTPTETAAWAIVSRVLLNLDETLTKS